MAVSKDFLDAIKDMKTHTLQFELAFLEQLLKKCQASVNYEIYNVRGGHIAAEIQAILFEIHRREKETNP